MRDTTGNLPPMPGIFPDMMAPVVRTGSDGATLPTKRAGEAMHRHCGRKGNNRPSRRMVTSEIYSWSGASFLHAGNGLGGRLAANMLSRLDPNQHPARSW